MQRKQTAVSASTKRPEPDSITMGQLLEKEPLHSRKLVSPLFSNVSNGWIYFPEDIRVHCPHQNCVGVRRHRIEHKSTEFNVASQLLFAFVEYRCTDCTRAIKVFGLRADWNAGSSSGFCVKIYQEPSFGNPIPKRLFELIGESNRDSFLQARRAAARGLGIGAYAYYRRMVENTKFDLITSVLGVARATAAAPGQIELLETAQAERQFSKAIGMLHDVAAVPAVLLIDGHNPLTLLHDLLSEGIHELSDEQCLERAQHAEIILCEIADRMQTALTERKNVKAAITSIMTRKRGTGSAS